MTLSSTRRWRGGIQAVLILYWAAKLQATDSYYVIYLLLCAGGLIGLYRNESFLCTDWPRWEKVMLTAFAAMMAVITVITNYEVMDMADLPYGWHAVSWVLTLAGGLALFYHLISLLAARLRGFSWAEAPRRKVRPLAVFFGAMTLFAALDMAFLFLGFYPGVITNDSIDQMVQTLSNRYTNHHPFYHTLFIKGALELGRALFGGWGSGVAVYSVFQILFLSACFAYVMVTLWQMRLPVRMIALCFLWYLLMPYHIMYSFTVWKDVPFGGMTLLFVTALFRSLYRTGRHRWPDMVILTLGGLGMCLFRSNGLPAFALTALVFILAFGRKRRLLALLMVCVVIVSAVLKYPVLASLDVSQPDPVESLSIPVQQIARVICDCNDLTEEERELLGKVVDVDAVPETYSDYISDSIKNLVRDTGDQDYLTAHKGEYLQLWLRLLVRHPWTYVKAWIDETKGYWNGGYKYWIWWTGVSSKAYIFQFTQEVRSPVARAAFDAYLTPWQNSPLLQPFVSIGLHTWLTLGLAVLCLLRRSRAAILTVPVLAVVATLLIATPVYSEFRYAYAVFTCLPMLLFASFYRGGTGDV